MKPPVIDVHCHAFNLSDLPAAQYFSRIVLREWGIGGDILGNLAKAMIWKAPDAETELTKLGLGAVCQRPSSSPVDEESNREIARVLFDLETQGHDVFNLLRRDSNALLDRFGRLKGRYLTSPEEQRLRAFSRPYGHRLQRISFQEFSQVLDTLRKLASHRLGQAVQLGLIRYIEWLRGAVEYRCSILQRLIAAYGEDVDLFTPAMVDFEYWLGLDSQHPGSGLAAQLDLSELLSSRSGGRVHYFAPFNPLREIVEGGALDAAIEAVQERGFVGVKIYPPMGFRLWDNSQVNFKKYWRSVHPKVRPLLGTLGADLDAVLEQFYEKCSHHCIPILSHCAPTQNPRGRPEDSPHPDHWLAMQRATNFTAPPILFGHFGGIENIFEGPSKSDQWVADIIRVLDEPGANAHTDLSDFVGLKDVTPDLNAWLQTFYQPARRQEKLLYGSDWFMLARAPRWREYFGDMSAVFAGMPQRSEYFGAAAWRFLFGQCDSAGQKRLTAWYAKQGVPNPGWLENVPGPAIQS